MDKETLSNYGWIVICVLVLAVMIALAGPFGNFVADAVKSTTQGLFDTNQSALDAAGITIEDQAFWQAQNGAKAYYDRVYAVIDESQGWCCAGIWRRDGSMTFYNFGYESSISADKVRIEGNRIYFYDPYCPSSDAWVVVNSDGSVIESGLWYYNDFDPVTQTYGSKEFAGATTSIFLTEYTSIQDWMAANGL